MLPYKRAGELLGYQEKGKDKETSVQKEERRDLSGAERNHAMSILKGNDCNREEDGEIKSDWKNPGNKEKK